jgi:uncharacterized protein YacL
MAFSLTIVGVLIIVLGFLRLRHVSLQGMMLGLIGAILGLLLGALASAPLSKLPEPFGSVLPVVISIVFTIALVIMVLGRRRQILGMLPFLKLSDKSTSVAPSDSGTGQVAPAAPALEAKSELPQILVDTSVIIDGRIADIAAAGFVPGRLVVPRFVLAELQNIADSDDAMRRGRGRRGLDVLNRVREMPDVQVDIIEDDVQGIREVDAKLVALAQRFSCNVLTTDYNLNRVAQIQGVRVLNVNELSNAIRPVVLPGEQLTVRVVQPGKERNQGVGYLADGTMIVVENGDKLIGQEVVTEVTRVFQTVAGKMIFAAPKKMPGSSNPAPSPDPISPAPPPVQPSAAKPEIQSEPAEKTGDQAIRKNRFGRRKPRPGGASNDSIADQPGRSDQPNQLKSTRAAGIEDRIIAATNKPRQSPEQS